MLVRYRHKGRLHVGWSWAGALALWVKRRAKFAGEPDFNSRSFLPLAAQHVAAVAGPRLMDRRLPSPGMLDYERTCEALLRRLHAHGAIDGLGVEA